MVLDTLFSTFGPFVIPVVLFAAGVVGYGVLLALSRAGVLGARLDPTVGVGERDPDPDPEQEEDRERDVE